MKRVLAAVAAVAMIGFSVYVRAELDDDGGSDGASSSEGRPVLVCVTELREVCEGLDGVDVRIEDAGDTADAIVAGDEADFDAWLAPAPWPGIVAGRVDGELGAPSGVLARSPAVVAIWGDRADDIAGAACGQGIGFQCLSSLADADFSSFQGEFPGKVKVGIPPSSSATGLTVLGNVAAAGLGRSDFATNDFESGVFEPTMRRLADQGGDGDVLQQMLQQGPGKFTAVGSIEAVAGPLVNRSPRKSDVRLIYPSPVATADLVLTPATGSSRLSSLAGDDDLLDRLADRGWRVNGRALAPGLDPSYQLPQDDGLPEPGVLAALRSFWDDLA